MVKFFTSPQLMKWFFKRKSKSDDFKLELIDIVILLILILLIAIIFYAVSVFFEGHR